MKMKLMLYFMLFFSLLACRHLSNKHSNRELLCGEDLDSDNWVKLRSSNSNEINPNETTIETLGEGGPVSPKITKKGCFSAGSKGVWIVKDLSKNEAVRISFPEQLEEDVIRLIPSSQLITRPICAESKILNSQFDFSEFFERPENKEIPAMFKLNFSQNGRMVSERPFQFLPVNEGISLSDLTIPDGKYSLKVEVKNTVQKEVLVKTCTVEIDSKEPFGLPDFLKIDQENYKGIGFRRLDSTKNYLFDRSDDSVELTQFCLVPREDYNDGIFKNAEKKCDLRNVDRNQPLPFAGLKGFFDFRFRHKDRAGNWSKMSTSTTILFQQVQERTLLEKIVNSISSGFSKVDPLIKMENYLDVLQAVKVWRGLPTELEKAELSDLISYITMLAGFAREEFEYIGLSRDPGEYFRAFSRFGKNSYAVLIEKYGRTPKIKILDEGSVSEIQLQKDFDASIIRAIDGGVRIVVIDAKSRMVSFRREGSTWFTELEMDLKLPNYEAELGADGQDLFIFGQDLNLYQCGIIPIGECKVIGTLSRDFGPISKVMIDVEGQLLYLVNGATVFIYSFADALVKLEEFSPAASRVNNLRWAQFDFFLTSVTGEFLMDVHDYKLNRSTLYITKKNQGVFREDVLATLDTPIRQGGKRRNVKLSTDGWISFVAGNEELVSLKSFVGSTQFGKSEIQQNSSGFKTQLLKYCRTNRVLLQRIDNSSEALLRQYQVTESEVNQLNEVKEESRTETGFSCSSDGQYIGFTKGREVSVFEWDGHKYKEILRKKLDVFVEDLEIIGKDELFVMLWGGALFKYDFSLNFIGSNIDHKFTQVSKLFYDSSSNVVYNLGYLDGKYYVRQVEVGSLKSKMDSLNLDSVNLGSTISDEKGNLKFIVGRGDQNEVVEYSLHEGRLKHSLITQISTAALKIAEIPGTRLISVGSVASEQIYLFDYPRLMPIEISNRERFRDKFEIEAVDGLGLFSASEFSYPEKSELTLTYFPKIDQVVNRLCYLTKNFVQLYPSRSSQRFEICGSKRND